MKMTNAYWVAALATTLALGASACMAQDSNAQETESDSKPAASASNEENDTLYAMGLFMAQQFAQFDLSEAELEQVKQGLFDGVLGKEPRVDPAAFGPKIQMFAQGRMTKAMEKNKAAGEEFCAAAVANEAGASREANGMVFVPIKDGAGSKPQATDTVKLHYHGTLLDGTVFDSSVDKGTPATFALNAVVPCFSVGVQKIAVGGKGKLICPSDTAYGDRGSRGIPPGATLIFEVEVLDIVSSAAGPATTP